MTTLERLDEGLYTASQHHSMLGLHLGARMTVAVLPGGGVFVHSPIAMTDALRAEVDAIGPVTHIVVPNLFHHVYAGPWIAAYPEAITHAPRGMRKKRPDLRVDEELGAQAHADWEGALVPHSIEGCMLGETVFVHPASRTVVSVDLLENFTTSAHWPTRQYLKVAGIHGRPGWSRLLRPLYRDRRAARRSVDALLEHEFDKVIVAHGDIVRGAGPDAVRQTFEGWLR
ncbi:MAG: DUF4336 domain-containing protein [Sandaracinaceae bacterium]